MANGLGCFYCRRYTNKTAWKSTLIGNIVEFNPIPGPRQFCQLGLDTSKIDSLEDVVACPKGEPQLGFRIGGYYRHMWFEGDIPQVFENGSRIGGCLEWFIGGVIGGETDFSGTGNVMEFHLCDWKQIERWVKFWGRELRRRGWVPPEGVE